MTTRILVVDDQALLRTAFSSLIDAEEDLEVVGQAADGRQAVELAAALGPDVVVMDVRMPVTGTQLVVLAYESGLVSTF